MSATAWRFYSRKSVSEQVGETRDGTGAADNNKAYWYSHPTAERCFPFTEWQYARLLVMRGRFQDGKIRGDTWPEVPLWEVP